MSTVPSSGPVVPIAEYRPCFVLWTSFLAQMPYQLFFSFWAGGFVGGLVQSFLPGAAMVARQAGTTPFILIGVLVLIGFPVVTLTMKKLNYASTTYQVLPDRLVMEEGFFTQHRKEIALSGVREVNLRRGVLQRLVGLGSVYIATQATGTGQNWTSLSVLGGSSTFGSGAMLRDLADPADAYAVLKDGRMAVRS